MKTMYEVQYRYINGTQRWKLCTLVFGKKEAETSMANMIRLADAPCEGRVVVAGEKVTVYHEKNPNRVYYNTTYPKKA